MREGGFCATLFRTARNSLILNGEMSEWSIEHAWKLIPLARADAHQIPPTHSRSTTSLNTDTRRHVLVNHRVDRGFEGVCDTVLTQNLNPLPRWLVGTSMYAATSWHRARGGDVLFRTQISAAMD